MKELYVTRKLVSEAPLNELRLIESWVGEELKHRGQLAAPPVEVKVDLDELHRVTKFDHNGWDCACGASGTTSTSLQHHKVDVATRKRQLEVKDGTESDLVATACNLVYDILKVSSHPDKAILHEGIVDLIRQLACEDEDLYGYGVITPDGKVY